MKSRTLLLFNLSISCIIIFFLGERWTSGQGGTLLDRVRPRYFHLFLLSFSESILHVQPEQKKNNSSLSSAAAVIIQVAS
jgi:hypothetical protein